MSKLLAVTTFCHADVWLAEKRAEYMRTLGVQPTHDLLLIGDSSTSEVELESLRRAYAGVFKEIHGRRISEMPKSAEWPHGCNYAWRISTKIVAGKYGQPRFDPKPYVGWFYFECDITPLNPLFMGILESQYLFHKKPFMGYVGPVKVKKTIQGVESESMVDHMNGAGVYPVSTQFYSQEAMMSQTLPWDVAGFAGMQLQKVHRIPNDVYLMGFRSRGLKKVADHTYSGEREIINQVGTNQPYTINTSNAILHHGCKDGSLMDAVLGKVPCGTSEPKPESLNASVIKLPEVTQLHPQTFDILKDHGVGMKWKDLISKYKIAPVVLKSILPPKK